MGVTEVRVEIGDEGGLVKGCREGGELVIGWRERMVM